MHRTHLAERLFVTYGNRKCFTETKLLPTRMPTDWRCTIGRKIENGKQQTPQVVVQPIKPIHNQGAKLLKRKTTFQASELNLAVDLGEDGRVFDSASIWEVISLWRTERCSFVLVRTTELSSDFRPTWNCSTGWRNSQLELSSIVYVFIITNAARRCVRFDRQTFFCLPDQMKAHLSHIYRRTDSWIDSDVQVSRWMRLKKSRVCVCVRAWPIRTRTRHTHTFGLAAD